MKSFITTIFSVLFCSFVFGQNDSTNWSLVPSIYLDVYNSEIIAQDSGTTLYQHPKSDGHGLNHAVFGVTIQNPKKTLGINISGQVGDFVDSNYGTDPARNLYDANIYYTWKKWKFEGGIFGSHFYGPFSTKGFDNPTVSFGKLSENTPYGNFAIQGTYTTGRWSFTQSFMPGYQKLGTDNNRQWSIGQKVSYSKGSWTANLATLFGNEQDRGLKKENRLLFMPDFGYSFMLQKEAKKGQKAVWADCKLFATGAFVDEAESQFQAVSLNFQTVTSHRVLFGIREEYAKSDLFGIPSQWNLSWSFGYLINENLKIRIDFTELNKSNRILAAIQYKLN